MVGEIPFVAFGLGPDGLAFALVVGANAFVNGGQAGLARVSLRRPFREGAVLVFTSSVDNCTADQILRTE